MGIKSMTGFARTHGNRGPVSWHWEVRSVNGRGLDVRMRLPPGYDGLETRIRELAARYVARLEAAHDGSPYHLGGYSFGGVIAFEMARQLEEKGATVASVSLIDSELLVEDARKPDVSLSALWVMLRELGPSRPGMWAGLDLVLASGGIAWVCMGIVTNDRWPIRWLPCPPIESIFSPPCPRACVPPK